MDKKLIKIDVAKMMDLLGTTINPDLAAKFLTESIELHAEHLNLIGDTLPIDERIVRQNVLMQGGFLLSALATSSLSKLID